MDQVKFVTVFSTNFTWSIFEYFVTYIFMFWQSQSFSDNPNLTVLVKVQSSHENDI